MKNAVEKIIKKMEKRKKGNKDSWQLREMRKIVSEEIEKLNATPDDSDLPEFLIKEICWNCCWRDSKVIWERYEALPAYMQNSGRISLSERKKDTREGFDLDWNNNSIPCHCLSMNHGDIEIPPEHCPYRLEHLILR